MQEKAYKTKSGRKLYRPVLDDDSELEGGFCLACAAYGQCAEPDARKYECESCGEHMVYGMEELLLMGLVSMPVEN